MSNLARHALQRRPRSGKARHGAGKPLGPRTNAAVVEQQLTRKLYSKFNRVQDGTVLSHRIAAHCCQPHPCSCSDTCHEAAFKFFDRNRDGVVTREEFKVALETLGFDATPLEREKLLNKYDSNGDGLVSCW